MVKDWGGGGGGRVGGGCLNKGRRRRRRKQDPGVLHPKSHYSEKLITYINSINSPLFFTTFIEGRNSDQTSSSLQI